MDSFSSRSIYISNHHTTTVMIKFQAAQPALLYLVPACLASSFLTAVVRGEVKEMLAYSEEVEEEEEEKATSGINTTDKKNDWSSWCKWERGGRIGHQVNTVDDG